MELGAEIGKGEFGIVYRSLLKESSGTTEHKRQKHLLCVFVFGFLM